MWNKRQINFSLNLSDFSRFHNFFPKFKGFPSCCSLSVGCWLVEPEMKWLSDLRPLVVYSSAVSQSSPDPFSGLFGITTECCCAPNFPESFCILETFHLVSRREIQDLPTDSDSAMFGFKQSWLFFLFFCCKHTTTVSAACTCCQTPLFLAWWTQWRSRRVRAADTSLPQQQQKMN